MRKTVDCLLILIYILTIITANGLVTEFGQVALLFTAFILIPFDLVVRDLLQDRWMLKNSLELRLRMAVLILGGSLISYWTTIASTKIAMASMAAFVLTGTIDAITYQWMAKRGRLFRINLATIIGAFTDSLVFASLAFDNVDYVLVVSQAGIKILGGVVWSLILYRYFRSYSNASNNHSKARMGLGTQSLRT